MSNNIYNILNNFNKVAQDVPTPVTSTVKTKTKLQESVEGLLSEKYKGFKKTEAVGKNLNEGDTSTKADPWKNVSPRVDKPAIKGTDKKAKTGYFPNTKQVKKLEKPIDEANDGNLANNAKPYDKVTRGDVVAGRLGKDEMGGKKKKVKEVAPPGAKAERMVKHIKKGYAKDGKITPKEKSIAYATAWKAHNKGKVEEAIKAMFESGYTKEQIVEGWEEMLKSVEKSRRDEKGTGKFDKKKDQTTGGTVYTRKYNSKTGETDDTENVSKEKRGRGRPKKSTFESRYSTVNKMITESFLSEQGTAPIQPKDADKLMKSSDPNIFNKLTGSKDTAAKSGTIKQGVWTADTPKAGEKPVPAPQNPEVAKEDEDLAEMLRLAGLEEADVEEGNEFSGALARAKATGAKEFEVDGKSYPVKEDVKIDECGMSPMGNGIMDQNQQDGKMSVNSSMDSDGHKSVTITADGNAAAELMQMLKLAGMESNSIQTGVSEPEGVMVVSSDEEVEEDSTTQSGATAGGVPVGSTPPGINRLTGKPNAPSAPEPDPYQAPPDRPAPTGSSVYQQKLQTSTDQGKSVRGLFPQNEEKDERYHASTTPDEQVEPVQAQTKGGNGDVAGQEKKMRKGGYQFGDNNLAMKEVAEGIDGLEAMGRKLYKEYQSIKVQK